MSARRKPVPQGSKAQVKTARAEREYFRSLSKVAHHIGDLINGFPIDDPQFSSEVTTLLEQYAQLLVPWARFTAKRMIQEVNARDLDSWRTLGVAISQTLRNDIRNTPVGDFMRKVLDENVDLITSLPREAAQRVHKLTLEGLTDSTRASTISKEIAASGAVSTSRALLIARSEVSRTASVLTQARAQQVGSPGYIWETSSDAEVRPSHKAMQGQFVPWNEPPTLDKMTGHAGCFPNCRCWSCVVLAGEA